MHMTHRALWTLFLLTGPAWQPQPALAQSPTYPPTRRDSVVDTYFGTKVADPYRWLELDSPATTAWVASQQRFTTQVLDRLPQREAIRQRLTTLSGFSTTDVPWREAGRIFYTERSGSQHQPVLYMKRTPRDPARVVLDPATLSPDGSVEVSDFAVSPDGRWLSYAASPGGADVAETHVRSLDTQRQLGDVVTRTLGPACWTADGAGFFYARRPAPRPGDAPNAKRIEKQLFYHVLGQPESRDRMLHEWTENYRWLYCMFSDDGRRAFAVAGAVRASGCTRWTSETPRSPISPRRSCPSSRNRKGTIRPWERSAIRSTSSRTSTRHAAV
jgi:prolyl oligopeptidase